MLLTGGTTRTVVENLTILRNAVAGVELFDADDGRNGNTIHNNMIIDNELGIQLFAGSENSIVENNVIGGNLGEAILIQFSNGHLIEGNTIHGIPTDPHLDSDGGVLLDVARRQRLQRRHDLRHRRRRRRDHARARHDNRIEGVVMYRNGDAGVIIQDSDRNQVIGITAHRSPTAASCSTTPTTRVVKDSDLRFNPSGVEASNSNNLLIEGNDGSQSSQAGFEIGNGVNIVSPEQHRQPHRRLRHLVGRRRRSTSSASRSAAP